MTARRSRGLWVAAAVLTLLLAAVAGTLASSFPDGLESVAEQLGISEQAAEHPVAGSPLSDYEVKGVEDASVSSGLAGVAGVTVVLALAGGLAVALRRRGASRDEGPLPPTGAPGAVPASLDRGEPAGGSASAGAHER